MPKQKKTWLARLLVVPFGLVIGLIAAEALCRVFVPATSDISFIPDPIVGFRHEPNQRSWHTTRSREFSTWFTTNSFGDPDIERTKEKPGEVCRVAVLGDSMVEAAQVWRRHRFTTLLEQELSGLRSCFGRTVSGVEVLNFGVRAWGTAQELLYYQTHVREFAPDLVLVAFFPVNDVRNNSFELEVIEAQRPELSPFFEFDSEDSLVRGQGNFYQNAKKAYRKKVEVGGRITQRLARSSRMFSLMAHVWRRWTTNDEGISSPRGSDPTLRAVFDPRVQARSGNWIAAWKITAHLFGEFRRAVQSDGSLFVALILPASMAPSWIDDRLGGATNNGTTIDVAIPYRLAKKSLRQAKVPFISLLPVFEQAAKTGGESLHFESDGHLTAAGHRLVAEILKGRIRDVLESNSRDVE